MWAPKGKINKIYIYKCAKAMRLAFVLLDLCVRQPNDAKI